MSKLFTSMESSLPDKVTFKADGTIDLIQGKNIFKVVIKKSNIKFDQKLKKWTYE